MTQVNQSCPVSSTLTYAPNLQKMFIWLVVSTPLENTSQLGLLFPRYGKIKKGPSHRPVIQVAKLQIVAQRLQLALHVGRVCRLFALFGLRAAQETHPSLSLGMAYTIEEYGLCMVYTKKLRLGLCKKNYW